MFLRELHGYRVTQPLQFALLSPLYPRRRQPVPKAACEMDSLALEAFDGICDADGICLT